MKIDQYDVYFSNGEMKSFNGRNVVEAWLRGMSYTLVTNRDCEVAHVVNHRTMEIFSDFEWDVSFSLKDKAYISGNPIRYVTEEVETILTNYAKFVGNSLTHALDWFHRNKKLK